MIDDAELLRRYAEEKSEAAFAELVQRHLDLVYSAALRRLGGDAHGAADVVQQVFGALARQASSLARHTVLPAWLYAATRNVAVDHVRAERRRQVREQEAYLMHELNSGPGASAEWENLRPLLDEAMDALGGRDREAVVLRFFARQPFGEIGRALNLSEDAARMRVERALEKLRGLLGRRGVTSTAAALGLALSHHAVVAAPAGFGATVTAGALTSASAAAAAPGFVSFMSTSKIAAGVTGLVLAAALGTAVHEVRASRAAGVAISAAARENEALAARLRGLERDAITAEQSAAALQKSLEAARAAEAAEKQRATAANMAAVAARRAQGEAFLARHPEVKQAAIDYWRSQMAGTYSPLFRALGLTSAQVERFKDLSIQGISTLTTTPDGRLLTYNLGGNRSEAMREMKTMLGDDGYRQYQEFDRVLAPAWQRVTELAASLYDTTAPLTAAQGEQLLRIFAENRTTVDGSSRPPFNWPAIMPHAEQVLSTAQLKVLGAYRASSEYDQAFEAQLRVPAPPGK